MVNFILDTGASRTQLGEEDALKLGAGLRDLHRSHQVMAGVGGKAEVFEMDDVMMVFHCEDQGVGIPMDLRTISVLKNPKKVEKVDRKKGRKKVIPMHVPSLLGTDFLHENKAAIHCDFCKKYGYIEID